MASSIASSKQLIGQLCDISDLIGPLLQSIWRYMDVYPYQNNTNFVIRHTGVRITLISVDEGDKDLVFILDWGQDRAGVGKLQIASLEGDDLQKHNKENGALSAPLRIPLQVESIRMKLVQIFTGMWEYFKGITYNVTKADPSGSEMNCRGFCFWLMDKLRVLQSADGEANTAKDNIDGVVQTDKWMAWSTAATVVATALLGSSALLAKSGDSQKSKK